MELGCVPPTEEVAAHVKIDHGVLVIVSISPAEPKRDEDLTQLQRDVLEVVAGLNTPASLAKLARMAGYSYSSHFRAAIGELVTRGLLVRTPAGVARK